MSQSSIIFGVEHRGVCRECTQPTHPPKAFPKHYTTKPRACVGCEREFYERMGKAAIDWDFKRMKLKGQLSCPAKTRLAENEIAIRIKFHASPPPPAAPPFNPNPPETKIREKKNENEAKKSARLSTPLTHLARSVAVWFRLELVQFRQFVLKLFFLLISRGKRKTKKRSEKLHRKSENKIFSYWKKIEKKGKKRKKKSETKSSTVSSVSVWKFLSTLFPPHLISSRKKVSVRVLVFSVRPKSFGD